MKVLIILSFMLTTWSVNATPYRYTFVQGGYPEGATVEGMFYGEDIDLDGVITRDEVTEFVMVWSGNSVLRPWTWVAEPWPPTMNQSSSLRFTATTAAGDLFPAPGSDDLAAISERSSMVTGSHVRISNATRERGEIVVANSPHYVLQTTTNPAVMTSVPIPAGFWLFGSGLLGLIWAGRRKQHNCTLA